jgi:hypothetical protein
MSVSGKGFLEQAMLTMYESGTGNAAFTTEPEIIVTIDGNVVLDLVFNGQAAQGMYYAYGLTSMASAVPIQQTASQAYPVVNVLGCYVSSAHAVDATNSIFNLTFPSSAQQTAAGTSIVSSIYATPTFFLDNPIYFQQSLLIQVKGVSSNYSMYGNAKARY